MNKKGNLILIVIILFLLLFALRGPFFACHFTPGCTVTRTTQDMDDVQNRSNRAMNSMDEAMKKVDRAMRKVDQDMESVNAMMVRVNNGVHDAVLDSAGNLKKDTIVYGGYLIHPFAYPIVFNFEAPFKKGKDLVRREVFFPRDMKEKIAICDIDSTNSIQVSLNCTNMYTRYTTSFRKKRVDFSQTINYRFFCPKKGSGGRSFKLVSGSFESKGKLDFNNTNLPGELEFQQKIDQAKRLDIENVAISKIKKNLHI